ncbi:MAG: hypothetical protein M1834_008526 [Cirrosporium novae-zelandiae]|nr:MAG: hypothetical protein M1834_008526 [Cirrosporium novae-zelandiae]
MAPLGETIAVFDKSGKIVSTSKHIFAVFKEAKDAYKERKAEIRAVRAAERFAAEQEQQQQQQLRRAIKSRDSNDDGKSIASSHRSHRSSRSKHHSKSHGHSRFISEDLGASHSPAELDRRHTTQDGRELAVRPPPGALRRANTTPAHNVDMDLAYGELPPDFHEEEAKEPAADDGLDGLVTRCKDLLDEADCAGASATAMIQHLNKNPDAMAAVALTLAEISNIVTKMSPGIITALKGAAPAVFALLASPQFLIAAGVGVGVTVVMLGGYKVIKKIQAQQPTVPLLENAPAQQQPEVDEGGMDELLELGTSNDRIENWRRGIADAEANSAGTGVDGEFITPNAARLSCLNVNELKSQASSRKERKSKSSKSGRSHSGGHHSSGSKRDSSKKEKVKVKAKKPSPLRLMFHV